MTSETSSDNIIDNRVISFESKFKECAKDMTNLKIGVGYFYLNGFNIVKEELSKMNEILLIMGSETDKATATELQLGHEERIKRTMINEMNSTDFEENSDSIIQLHTFITTSKLKVKIYDNYKFHAKAYIFESKNQPRLNRAILGSSNFSASGMCMGKNLELNSVINHEKDIEALTRWFNQIWNEAKDFKKDMLKIIEMSQPYVHKKENDKEYLHPIELLKLMIKEFLDDNISSSDSILAKFQEIGYVNAMEKIKHLNGCLISDSVGLGKTFIGLKMIEQFQKQGKNILLIVPASIKDNWKNEINQNNFEIKNSDARLKILSISKFAKYDLTNTNGRMKLDNLRKKYNVIMIDEAHRFRNFGKFEDGKYSGNKNYANIIYLKSKLNKYALLTATPLNNSINDLYNLLNVFLTDEILMNYDSELKFNDFKDYSKYDKKIKNEKQNDFIDNEAIAEYCKKKSLALSGIMKILEEVMILRTRSDINRSYPDLKIAGKNVTFTMPRVNPEVYDANAAYTEIYGGITDLLDRLNAPHISLINENAGDNLIGLFKILLYKRIESSIFSFHKSLERLIQKESELLDDIKEHGWETVKNMRSYSEDIEKYIQNDDELNEFIEFVNDKSNENDTNDENVEKSIDTIISKQIQDDISLITNFLTDKISKVRKNEYDFDDPKLEKLIKIIKSKPDQKLLIFSQFVDTVNYLYTRLKEKDDLKNINIDCITGSNQANPLGSDKSTYDKIKLFSPHSNDYELSRNESQIDILIATDSLSEGVNLQDCHTVINYDLPWNPTRIIQRVGRVDRIGNTETINVHNILPNPELDVFLELITKLQVKIERIVEIIGKDNYILTEDEEINPQKIGEKINRIKMADDFSEYEKVSKNKLFNTMTIHEDVASKKLKIEQLARDVGYSKNPPVDYDDKTMYSIVKHKNKKGFFAMFRIYDKIEKKKIKNLTIYYDINKKSFNVIDIDNLSLEEFYDVLSKKTSGLDFETYRNNIEQHFEKEHFGPFSEKYSTSVMITGVEEDSLIEIILFKLRKISDTRTLSSDLDLKEKAGRLLRLFSRIHLLHDERELFIKNYLTTNRIAEQRKEIQAINPEKFLSIMDEFYNNNISDNEKYTRLIRPEDIGYKIICWGAFV